MSDAQEKNSWYVNLSHAGKVLLYIEKDTFKNDHYKKRL